MSRFHDAVNAFWSIDRSVFWRYTRPPFLATEQDLVFLSQRYAEAIERI